MGASIKIDSSDIKLFKGKLEKAGKYDLPIVARQTLTGAAVTVKKKTLPRVFKQTFTNRKKTFIKANSKFKAAKGNDLNTMRSSVGIVKNHKQSSGKEAVRDLRFQEKGGIIKGRSFIPIDKGARVGGKNSRNVRKKDRLPTLESKLIHARRNKGKSPKERFIRSAIHANKSYGAGKGFVLSEKNSKGKQFVWRINQVNSSSGERKTFVKQEAVYSYESGRFVRVKGRRFLSLAATQKGKSMKGDFVKLARKRLKI